MDNSATNLSLVKSPEQKPFIAPDSQAWKEIAGDPASVIILYTLTLKEEFDLSEIDSFVPKALTDLFDKIVSVLCSEGLAEMTETKLRLIRQKDVLCLFDTKALANSIPFINQLASAKALAEVGNNIYGSGCRSFYYPIEQQEEALAILRETRVKFQKLLGKSMNSKSTKIGYATFSCTQLSLEDFT